jgi:hypothetical protein
MQKSPIHVCVRGYGIFLTRVDIVAISRRGHGMLGFMVGVWTSPSHDVNRLIRPLIKC